MLTTTTMLPQPLSAMLCVLWASWIVGIAATEHVVVRVHLPRAARQLQNGLYQRQGPDAFVRSLEATMGLRFTVNKASSAVAPWHLRGFRCPLPDPQEPLSGGVCEEVLDVPMAGEWRLAGDDDSHPMLQLASEGGGDDDGEGRRLQFDMPTQPEPPLVDDGTPIYYNCRYAGDNWCCNEYNTAAGGGQCWDVVNSCTEEYMVWSGQNIICCGGLDACVTTYEPPMPTPTPTTATPTPTPTPSTNTPKPEPTTAAPTPNPAPTTAPSTTPPFVITTPTPTPVPASSPPFVIIFPTPTPTTTRPTTTAPPPTSPPPETQAPTTAPPETQAPTTAPPATDAPTTAPPTTDAPTTAPPATEAPTTAPPETQAPTTAPPETQAPTTAPPATDAPTTAPPTTDAPTTAPPETQAPTTAPPATDLPTTVPSTDSPTNAPTPLSSVSSAPPGTETPTTTPLTTGASTSGPPSTNSPTTSPSPSVPMPSGTGAPATTAPTATNDPPTMPTTAPPMTSGPPASELPVTTAPTTSAPAVTTMTPPATSTQAPSPSTAPTSSPGTSVSPPTEPVAPSSIPNASGPSPSSSVPGPTPSEPATTSTTPMTIEPPGATPPPVSLNPSLPVPDPTTTGAPTPSTSASATSGPSETTNSPSLIGTVAPSPSTLNSEPQPVPSPTSGPSPLSPSGSSMAPASTALASTTERPSTEATMTTSPTTNTRAPLGENIPESGVTTLAPNAVAPGLTRGARGSSTTGSWATSSTPSPATLAKQLAADDGATVTPHPAQEESSSTTRDRSASADGDAPPSVPVFHQTMADFSKATESIRERVSQSANMLIATAVTANIVNVAITAMLSGTTAASNVATVATAGITASQGLLHATTGTVSRAALPTTDLTGLWMMLNYLQFIASGSHMSLPGAPHFFFEFTDSLGWSNFQPTTARTGEDVAKHKLSSGNLGNFTAADGDIISGVLAYAERLNVKPEELFTKTAIAFASVVGIVAAVVAFLYTIIRCIAKQRLELVIQRLKDLPRAKLLMRLLIQSCLSICLMSEYALSMTSSFQMRYYQQNDGGYGAFASATAALICVCFGLILLGVVKLWKKSEDELSNPDFKFAWGAYYKYYHYKNRYFFVPKMGAEILSGVIIGLVSDVPSQLTLLMSLQLAMFLYTVESEPYSMSFQTACSSVAFVMKMITYALISSFLTASTEPTVRDFVGTLVILLQVTLLLLFNSRQLYVLYKQMRYLMALRRQRLREQKEMDNLDDNTSVMMIQTSTALTPKYEATPGVFEQLQSKRNSMVTPPPPLPVAAA